MNPRPASTFFFNLTSLTPSSAALSSEDEVARPPIRPWCIEDSDDGPGLLPSAWIVFVRTGRGGENWDPSQCPEGLFKLRIRLGKALSSCASSTPPDASMKESFCGSMSSMDGIRMAVCMTLPGVTVGELTLLLLLLCCAVVCATELGRLGVAVSADEA